MPRITCVDPNSTVAYPRVIRDTGQAVPCGETVEVDAELAGHAPKGKPGTDGYDPGDGLLAQTDVWQHAKATPRPKPDTADKESD